MALCDTNPDKLQAAASAYQIQKVYTSASAMLASRTPSPAGAMKTTMPISQDKHSAATTVAALEAVFRSAASGKVEAV